MATVGDLIQHLQSYHNTLPVDELLGNPSLGAYVSRVIETWPTHSRRAITRLLRRSKRSGNSSQQSLPTQEALRAIRRVNDISMPSAISQQYQRWQRDPTTFWTTHGISLGDGDLPALYLGMKHLEVQRQSATIMWRFFTLFFYDLSLILGEGKKYMVDGLQKKILTTIDTSGLLPSSHSAIQTDLKRWTSAGSKYYNIAATLGVGALILLPQDVTDNIWEHRLPMKGIWFDEAMAHLRELGICKIADQVGATQLGVTVRNIILQPFDATTTAIIITL